MASSEARVRRLLWSPFVLLALLALLGPRQFGRREAMAICAA